MKRIKFIFKDGKIEVDAEGFQGSECIDTVDKILKALNPKVVDRKLKKEYYKTRVAAKSFETE